MIIKQIPLPLDLVVMLEVKVTGRRPLSMLTNTGFASAVNMEPGEIQHKLQWYIHELEEYTRNGYIYYVLQLVLSSPCVGTESLEVMSHACAREEVCPVFSSLLLLTDEASNINENASPSHNFHYTMS